MPKNRGGRFQSADSHSASRLDDHSLIDASLKGDDAALRTLMDRYDRLVRYAIFRTAKRHCLRDPQWLDTVASDTWTGLLRSFRREPDKRPTSLSTYLTAIARFQTLSAIRREGTEDLGPAPGFGPEQIAELSSAQPDPGTLLSDMDSLDLLRKCAALLPDSDKVILSQLNAITQRRWVEAGQALEMSESTLRSRWKRIIDRLRQCMESKSGGNIAPEPRRSD